MKATQHWRRTLWGFIWVLWITACAAPNIPAAQSDNGRINVARQAHLVQTTKLEIWRFDEKAARYTLAVMLTDKTLIEQIVQLLDKELPLQPALRCIDQYQLKFDLAAGEVQTFGYFCTSAEAYLRGGPIPEGRAVQPLGLWNEILRKQLPDN